MPKSGGYKVIDLAHKPLSNFATVYPGIYNDIESSNKMCVVSGLFAGGVEYDDFAVLFTGGTTLNGKVTDSLQLVITDDDEVTVVVNKPAHSIDFVDMTGIRVNESGLVVDYDTKLKFLALAAKGEPFYIKNLNTTLFNVGFDTCNLLVTSIALIDAQNADLGAVLASQAAQKFIGVSISVSFADGILFMFTVPAPVNPLN